MFTKVAFAAVTAVLVATIAACICFMVKADNECTASGGHTVTQTTYGYRYTPGTTKWEYGPIYNTTCQK